MLVFWPKRFLKFYDFWAGGDYVGKIGAWRNSVEKFESKLLEMGALVMGVVIIWDVLP